MGLDRPIAEARRDFEPRDVLKLIEQAMRDEMGADFAAMNRGGVCIGPDGVDRSLGLIDVIESRRQAEFNTKVTPRLSGRSILQSLQDPAVVIAMAELSQRLAKLGEISEGTQP
jgi:hypothetical protein